MPDDMQILSAEEWESIGSQHKADERGYCVTYRCGRYPCDVVYLVATCRALDRVADDAQVLITWLEDWSYETCAGDVFSPPLDDLKNALAALGGGRWQEGRGG